MQGTQEDEQGEDSTYQIHKSHANHWIQSEYEGKRALGMYLQQHREQMKEKEDTKRRGIVPARVLGGSDLDVDRVEERPREAPSALSRS